MRSKKTLTIFLVAILNFILSIIEVAKLKNNVPIKIFETDVVAKMAPKSMLFILPAIVLVISIIQVLYRMKTMSKAVTKFKIVEDFLFTLVDGILILYNWLLIYVGSYYTETNLVDLVVPYAYIAICIIGVIFIALFSTFPINRFKSKIGIRTKETLSDKKVWRITNRFAGFTGFVAGVCICLYGIRCILKGFSPVLLVVLAIICFFFMYYIPASYSSFVKRKLK